MNSKKIKVLIPARYQSTRFPGKPLALILGKALVIRVAEICSRAIGNENVYVVTDDLRIQNECDVNGYQSILSKKEAQTGTDRIASVMNEIDADIFLNVQGDEPCISEKDILLAIEAKIKYPDHVINGFCEFETQPSNITTSIPKVVMNENNDLIYISRANIPINHKSHLKNSPSKYLRQVCIYAFNSSQLAAFYKFGRRSALEATEDIEILRFFELGIQIKMMRMSQSLAVDYPDDIAIVEQHIKAISS
jgi:3-deoxy-manno-octulosonate cytidylyltransferase (CMP-KDO synthetase)